MPKCRSHNPPRHSFSSAMASAFNSQGSLEAPSSLCSRIREWVWRYMCNVCLTVIHPSPHIKDIRRQIVGILIGVMALATGLLLYQHNLLKLGQMQLSIVKWGFILGIIPIVSEVMNTFWCDFEYLGVLKGSADALIGARKKSSSCCGGLWRCESAERDGCHTCACYTFTSGHCGDGSASLAHFWGCVNEGLRGRRRCGDFQNNSLIVGFLPCMPVIICTSLQKIPH